MHSSDLTKRVTAMVETLTVLLGEHIETLTSFPRDIEKIITLALQVPVIRLPDLTLSSGNRYLCALRGDAFIPAGDSVDRKLNGLLYVGSPCAIVLICSELRAHIQAYILAHELGHLLGDVFLLQQLWLKSLSERADAVKAYFTWNEVDPWLELRGFLKGLPLRPSAIIGRGQNLAQGTSEREIIADLFAREILAPWDVVIPLYQHNDKRGFAENLRSHFNLPVRIAAHYHDDINLHLRPKLGFYDRLLSQLVVPVDGSST